ncbi:Diacylglycerol pyrophosphate phosphatase 1 [Paramyrothecium foliicola]|nr:Diacylglycerol pyrophosphate phosphatase 1 [Paramyrothecium foliicola]
MAPSRLNGTGAFSSIARFWTATHAPDYIGFAFLLTAWIVIVQVITPFHQMFFINDLRISFPHAEHQRVSEAMNIVYAIFVPLVVLAAWNLIARSSPAKHEVTYLSFGISIVLTAFITDVVKNAVGRPRPDLLSRCQAASGTKPNLLVTIDACTAPKDNVLHDGWRSFPSGHSSSAFAGLGFLALFFAGQLHVFRHAAGGRDLSRALLCLAPLLGAAMIAISRCEDYRHDVYDVCIGSALGMTVAYWSYRRHWPHLSSPHCDEPYPPPKTDMNGQQEQAGWQRVRDEEEAGADVGYEMSQISRA